MDSSFGIVDILTQAWVDRVCDIAAHLASEMSEVTGTVIIFFAGFVSSCPFLVKYDKKSPTDESSVEHYELQ